MEQFVLLFWPQRAIEIKCLVKQVLQEWQRFIHSVYYLVDFFIVLLLMLGFKWCTWCTGASKTQNVMKLKHTKWCCY